MKRKMSDDELLNQIEILERQAVGYWSGEIAHEQAKALDYYNGAPFGNEVEGQSAVVSSDVWDVVEGLTPLVLKPFLASDDVVRFNPLGAEDEEAAEQESDYINWVVTQRNDAFTQLVAWVKNGLLQKNGIVKYWWEKTERASVERYFGQPLEMVQMIAADKGVEIVEGTENVAEDGSVNYDIAVRYTEEIGHARYEVIAPEEFLVGREASTPDPQCASFVEHRRMVTIGDLRDMGYSVEDDISDVNETGVEYSQQYQARRGSDEQGVGSDETADPSMRRVLFREVFLLVDHDGNGSPELLKVCVVGRTILAKQEAEEIPFVGWTPYLQPHKFYGRCPADETLEIQLVKSTLWRQTLNNLYTINNNRVYANETVEVSDLIDNQIAGVVRIKGQGNVAQAVMAAQITPIGGVVQPMMEYLDSAKENRTGFTRYNQGTDSNSLNKTATGIRIIAENANQRVEIMSRAFANALAQLMRGIHGLCRRHATQAETVRLRGKWVQVDPRGWKKRIDMTVSVGLGAADQQVRLQGIQMLMNEQKAQMQIGSGTVKPEHLFAAAARLAEIIGFKNPEMFFARPEAESQHDIQPQVRQVLERAQQEIQQLQAENQQLKSGVAAKQIDAQSRQAIEVLRQQGAERDRQLQAFLAQMKEEAAHDREELKGVVNLLSKQIAPPSNLAAEVDADLAERGDDGQA